MSVERAEPWHRRVACLRPGALLSFGAALTAVVACTDGRPEGTSEEEVVPVLEIDTLWTVASDTFFRLGQMTFAGEALVVLNGGSRHVLTVDSTGVSSMVGGMGDGPGEFRSLRDVAVLADSTVVLDALVRRVQLFVRGDAQAEWSLRETTGVARVVGFDAGGRIVVGLQQRPSSGFIDIPAGVVHLDSMTFMVAPNGSGRWEPITTVPRYEYYIGLLEGRRYIGLPSFHTGVHFAPVRGGVVMADGRDGLISWLDFRGDIERIAVVGEGRQPPTQEEMRRRNEAVERTAARLRDPDLYRAQSALALAARGDSLFRPVVEDVVADDRTLAVQMYDFGQEQPETWRLLDRVSGRVLGELELPGNLRLTALSGSRLAAVATDSLDVESLMVLEWGGARLGR